MEPGASCTQSGCLTTAPPSQRRVSIVNKLFYCFDAMGRNVKKQNRICGKFQQIHFFSHIFKCMNTYILQFLIFTGVGLTALIA